MALITLLPVANFMAFPGAGAALVMALFLIALGLACRLLLISAAKVVAIRNTGGLSRPETQLDSAASGSVPLPLYHWSTGREYLN